MKTPIVSIVIICCLIFISTTAMPLNAGRTGIFNRKLIDLANDLDVDLSGDFGGPFEPGETRIIRVNFTHWVVSNGGIFDKIVLGFYNKFRGAQIITDVVSMTPGVNITLSPILYTNFSKEPRNYSIRKLIYVDEDISAKNVVFKINFSIKPSNRGLIFKINYPFPLIKGDEFVSYVVIGINSSKM